MRSETPNSPSRSPLAVLFLTVFLDLVGFGMVIPILPLYAETFHASDLQTGFLLSIYSIMQLIFSPILGRMSDRAGRRPVLLISILGSCGSQLGYAFSPSLAWLIIARAFAGMCGANITAAQAYIADVTDSKSRAAGMGMLGAALGLGFVFGPAIGGLLSHYSPHLPFLVAGLLSAVNFILALFILREPRPPEERSKARTLTWPGFLQTLARPNLLLLIGLFFLITFGFANLESTFALYLERRFDYGPRQTSYLFSYIGILIVLVQGGLVRRLVPRWGEKRLVVLGTLFMAFGLLLQAYTHQVSLLFLAIGVVAVGNGLNSPSLSALISREASGEEQGGVLGVAQAFGALGRILGPIAGTWALRFGEATPYVTGGVILFGACLLAWFRIRMPKMDSVKVMRAATL